LLHSKVGAMCGCVGDVYVDSNDNCVYLLVTVIETKLKCMEWKM